MKIVLALEADVQNSRFIFSPRSLQNDGHRHMYVSSTPAILELKGLSIAQKWGGGVLYIPFARYHMWIQIILGTYVVLSLSLIIDMQRSLM